MNMRCFTVIAALSASLLMPHGAALGQGTFTTLYSFTGGSDGAWPMAGLVRDQNGALYGTAAWGGSNLDSGCSPNGGLPGCGTVFQLTPPAVAGAAWTFAVLHSFTGYPGDGGVPLAGLAAGSGGVLYGTTLSGGNVRYASTQFGLGTVFQLMPPATAGATWTETVIYNLGNDKGGFPYTAVAVGKGGAIYGTSQDSFLGDATVFGLGAPAASGAAWTGELLFGENLGGDDVSSLLVRQSASGTELYGVIGGLEQCCGWVIELTPPPVPHQAWTVTYLYTFTGQNGDGANPTAGLAMAPNGTLYGTTYYGGAAGYGTVFELTPPTLPGGVWSETVLYSFMGHGDGALPSAALTIGQGGALYGTTFGGGTGGCLVNSTPGCGTVFRLTPPTAPGGSWTETVLHSFIGSDGNFPQSSLAIGNGTLYGTVSSGGAFGKGTVFALRP
jgi:uncharacterized repeat protein (TIGR03803 family)